MNPEIRRFFVWFVALSVLLPTRARADAIDDFRNGWTGRALAYQRQLDRDTPLADINVLGAHNAFNADVYSNLIRYIDPNQFDSIFNQLRMGARAIELDVHWTSKTEGPISFPDRLVLCHGTADHIGCSLEDRYFTEGLEEIAAWLGTSDSIDQVLLLHIEDKMDGQHGEAFAQVESRIGNHVYYSGGCSDIPGTLTKADVLAAGKRVVIWNEGACSGDGNWNSMVFTGLGGIDRTWEDRTLFGGGARPDIGPTEVRDLFAGGMNVVDLDELQVTDERWAAAVWSWDIDEPNDVGNEDCAAQIANGRWNDFDCNQERLFACENLLTGGWAVSATMGPFGLGAQACAALGEEYRFSVPTNSQDNQLLNGARINSGHDTAWLNYDDRAVEGEWARNDTEDVFFGAGGFTLVSGESLSGKSRMLRLEPNCNLVLYSLDTDVVGAGLWTSSTANRGLDCRVDFQSDGNLVLYDGGGAPLWSSSTSGAELRLQSDGNLVIYDGGGQALWATYTHYPSDLVVDAGQLTLTTGQVLHSANRRLILQDDCELEVLSFENGVIGGVVWRSNTAGAGTGCHADFQSDGNFVLYDGEGNYHWASGTSGTTGAQLRMQADGNVVIYNGANEPLWAAFSNTLEEAIASAGSFRLDPGQFLQTRNRKLEMRADCELVLSSVDNAIVGGDLWRSDTANAGTGCFLDFQSDGNLVLYDDAGNALWASGTSATVGAQLRLQPDGNAVLYNGAGESLWTTNTRLPTESTFLAGQFALEPGQFVRHENRILLFEADCNLALYELRNALPDLRLWQSNTAGAGAGCRLDFQSDGNLVLYDGAGQAIWAAGTSGTSGAEFRIQSDGNMVLYNGAGQALWTSQTPGNFSAVARCGDATCNGDESCSSCPSECGACAPSCDCGNGVLEVACGEQCDDGNGIDGDCCSSGCLIEAAGTPCRAASGVCDVAEVCDGQTPTCPVDGKVVAGTPCRAATGVCDVAEFCDGQGDFCPNDETIDPQVPCGVVDAGIVGKKLLVRDLTAVGRGGKVVFVAKDAGVATGAGTDAAAMEAQVEILYPGGLPRASFTLPPGAFDGQSGWKAGSSLRYSNALAPQGGSGVKTAVVKAGKTMKLVTKSTGDEPFDLVAAGAPSGPVEVIFTLQNGAETMRQCTSFSDCDYKSIAGDRAALLKCKNGAPASCPVEEVFERLPKARAPEHLFVIPTSAMTDAEKTMIASLQGHVSRNSSEQIFIHPQFGGYETWLQDLEETYGVGRTDVSDPWSLVDQFLSYVDGYLLFEAGDDSINAATSLAGVEKALVVESSIEGLVQLRGLPRLGDLRGLDETWVLENHGGRFNPLIAFEQRELFQNQLRGYGILAQGIFFYDGNSSFRDEVVAGLDPDAVVFGWGDATIGEDVFVGASSEHGVSTVAADHAHSLAPLSGIPTVQLRQQTHSTIAPEPGVHYATFILTDGDNVQWLLGSFQDSMQWFGSPDRGSFDMAYGIPPSLVHIANSVNRWYYANASTAPGRDFFLVGPSGSGYLYPSLYPPEALESHVDRLAESMGLADLNIVQILDFGSFENEALWDVYTAKPEIHGLVYLEYADYAAEAGDLGWSNGKPILSPRVKRWGSLADSDVATVLSRVNGGARDATSPLGYSVVMVAAWDHSLSDVKAIIQSLDSDVRVITPGELVQLVTDHVPHEVAVSQDYTGADFETDEIIHAGSSHWITDEDALFVPFPNRLRLTNNGGGQNGAAWHASPIDPAQSWTASYRFQISHPVGGGADGFGFHVHGDGVGANPGLLGNFSSPSLSVVVDTWDNGDGMAESLRVLRDGTEIWVEDLTDASSDPDPGSSSTVFRMELSYVAAEGRLRIQLVDEGGPDSILRDVAVDLGGMGASHAGFAATTGASAQNQDIRTFRLYAAAP